jgi:hypothetical protein
MLNKFIFYIGISLTTLSSIFAQCPTSGTVSSDCTTSGNLTITGNTLTINPGVTMTVTGTLKIQNGATINGTNAHFNIGTLQTGYGSVSTLNGGTYSIGSYTAGSATDFVGVDITSTSTFTTGYGVVNFTNSTINVAGLFSVGSTNNYVTNSTINTGTGNAGTNDAEALAMNGGGILTLTGNSQMNVRGWLTNNELYIDDSDVIVTGDFDNAGSEVLEVTNGGTITIGGDFNNSGSGNVTSEDGGIVQVDGDYDNSGGGSTEVNGGGLVVGGTYSGNTPTGDTGSNCTGGGGGCCGDACSTLPVQLISFKVAQKDNHVEIKWETLSEQNNSHFTIQKSYDGESYADFSIEKGAGTSSEEHVYNVIDIANGQQPTYYRLEQTDFDGTHKFLAVASIQIAQTNNTLKVYPNPVVRGGRIHISGSITSLTKWKIYNVKGVVTSYGTIDQFPWIETSDWERGLYFLNISSEEAYQIFRIVIE